MKSLCIRLFMWAFEHVDGFDEYVWTFIHSLEKRIMLRRECVYRNPDTKEDE